MKKTNELFASVENALKGQRDNLKQDLSVLETDHQSRSPATKARAPALTYWLITTGFDKFRSDCRDDN